MSNKAKIGIVVLVVVLAGLPLACKAKQEIAGQSAPNYGSPVEMSPEQRQRLDLMKSKGQKATLTVFPVRIRGNEEDAETASTLARMINDAGLCTATPAKQSLLLKAPLTDPNEMNKLFSLAEEFRDYVKKNPPDTDYVLYADYIFFPDNWNLFALHFIVCDRQGEWVILDLQNSDLPDFQSINPDSKEDCNTLFLKRLQTYLR